jgi:outer membrane immunogenic protein
MHRAIIAALAAFLGMGTAAYAADLGGSLKDGPAPVAYGPGYSWAGLYIGGSVGFGVGDTSGKITDIDFGRHGRGLEIVSLDSGPDFGSLFSSEYDVNGAVYGAHIGYNFQHGNYVFGVEAAFNGTDIDGSGSALFGLVTSERELDWYATAVARLGYAQGNMLFYGFGGVAWGTVETRLSFLGVEFADGESDHVGWTAGVGIEYAFNDRFSVRVEYAHVDLGEETTSLSVLDSGITLDDEVDMSFNTIKIGASLKLYGADRGLDAMK